MGDGVLPEDDFFAEFTKPSLARDRYDRPLIVPPEGGDPVPYTRASTLSDYITGEAKGLWIWKQRHLAKGLSEREDLAALAASLPVLTGDSAQDRETNRGLDPIIERAIDQAKLHYKADWGTAIHAFTDPETEPGPVPARMVPDVEAFEDAAKGLVPVRSETFCVCDELRVAGTFDNIYALLVWLGGPDAIWQRITDKKTGHLKPFEVAIQLAVYSRSVGYDIETKERYPLVETGTLDQEIGIAMHIPKGQGKAEFHEVNLTVGWEAAQHAAAIRDLRAGQTRLLTPAPDYFAEQRMALTIAIMQAESREQMQAVYETYRPIWTHGARDLARDRLSALGLHVAPA